VGIAGAAAAGGGVSGGQAAAYPGKAVPLVLEGAGGGQVALQELRAAVDFPVVEFGVRGSSKMARQEAVAPLAEAGQAWLPAPGLAR
jgi:hypothetical protein